MTLSIPAIDPGDDTLAAALAYAAAGWYVLPINRATKHAGSVLGKGWPSKTSRDQQQIVAWFAGRDDGLALHCGRSGAVVFDVDEPDVLPRDLIDAFEHDKPPMQATREGNARRGHYLYLQPPGRSIGNSTGKLGGAWGEVRGRNGIIVVAPTPHEKAAVGGRYHWLAAGDLPELPGRLADMLPDQQSAEDAVTDTEISAFLETHTASERPELIDGIVTSFRTALEQGEGRHPSAINAVCWATREARAGLFSARTALEAIWPIFRDALRDEPNRKPATEWRGIVAWAIGQAQLDDAAATHTRLTEQEPLGADSRDPEDQPLSPTGKLRAALIDTFGLDDLPMPEPLVDGVLFTDSIAWLQGKPGEGKTFVALDMAGCVSTGETWHGRPTKTGIVLYVIAEGVGGLKPRVRSWEHATGKRMLDVLWLPVAVQAGTDGAWQPLLELAHEIKPSLIVLDTQARVTVGMDENSAQDMGEFVARLEKLRRATGACVLVVHHQGRNGEHMRGSTALEGAATTVIRVVKDEDRIDVSNPKQKDAPEFDKFALRMVPMGESLVLAAADHRLTGDGPSKGALETARKWWESHRDRWVSMSALEKAGVAPSSTLYRHLNDLVDSALAQGDNTGRYQKFRLIGDPSVR